MNTHPTPQQDLRQVITDRAANLFQFLQELIQLRVKQVKHLKEYEKVFWLSDLPKDQNITSVFLSGAANLNGAQTWVEVRKPSIAEAPEAPEKLRPWLNPRHLNDPARDYPELLDKIPAGDFTGNGDERSLAEVRGEVLPLWETYVAEEWWPWRENARIHENTRKVFTELYSLYQRQEKFGEAYEVILGMGCLVWKDASGEVITRHLVTTPVNVQFDAAQSAIQITPFPGGNEFAFEQDMLYLRRQADPDFMSVINRQLESLSDARDEREALRQILTEWLNHTTRDGVYEDTLSIAQPEDGQPRIYFAPAIILRKRTDQVLLRVFSDIAERIRQSGQVPPAIESLVTVIENQTAAEKAEAEIYFPLPANEEQIEILEKLRGQHGVVVQGPPGTGKSHSIANLVAHFLASGKRVLVTSHTARALRVLKKMMPPEIASLCVVAPGDDERALQALEDSVSGIIEQHHHWESLKNSREIQRLEEKLQATRLQQLDILDDFRKIRETEFAANHPEIDNYTGTLSAIAARLQREKAEFQWLNDHVSIDQEAPLTNAEALQYLTNLRQLTPTQEVILRMNLIDPETLLTPAEFSALALQEASAQERLDNTKIDIQRMGQGTRREILAGLSPEHRTELITLLDQLLDTLNTLENHSYPWLRKAAYDALDGRHSVWEMLLKKTERHLSFIETQIDRISDVRITGIGGKDLQTVKDHALAMMTHLTDTSFVGFGIFRPKAVKEAAYLANEVFVNGEPCDDIPHLEMLVEFIDVMVHFEQLSVLWSEFTATPKKAPPDLQLAEYQNLLKLLRRVLGLHEDAVKLKAFLAAHAGQVDKEGMRMEQFRELRTILTIVDLEENHRRIRLPFTEMEQRLRQKIKENSIHPILKELLAHIENRDAAAYESTILTLKNVFELRKRLESRSAVSKKLQETVPALADALQKDPHNADWDARLQRFESAWNWAKMKSWLDSNSKTARQEQLKKDFESNQKLIAGLTVGLAAAKAWRHCFTRMTEAERQSLEAWSAAMRRIGKGTGKYARDDRRKARQHLENCRSAIPAWVMPIYRVAETIQPGREMFDVVIIDEASQSGPEALFLAYLGKQIIVVGDDKQISPEFIGVSRAAVDELRRKYLSDIPYNDAIGVENSFFDLARIRYGAPIRLREHFRSMPEIVGFSNQLCYQSEPLVPLRQFGSSRLAPVIVRRYVSKAETQSIGGGLVNVREAEMLVQQVRRCCEEQVYSGKSMGVISLQGGAQARFIEKLLLKAIGAEEMERRNIVCGDAYAFQGDERDVMFLSMVAAPNRRIGVLASEKDMRRFNVAFSRARDQVFLFHSVTLDDLSDSCLRYRLLSYCERPVSQRISMEKLDIGYLWEQAHMSSRERVLPPEPFESWFELDVFLKLVEQGARVMPGFEIDRFRIDLVVEGMRGRIGIECLGEHWKGEENFNKDLFRKMRLERCGWKFIPVYGSEFYRNPEQALESVWKHLAETTPPRGIYFNGTLHPRHKPVSITESA